LKSLLLVIPLILAVGITLVLLKKYLDDKARSQPWPFYLKKVMSQPEQILYQRLVAALPDHIVLAQVQLSRVLAVRKDVNRQKWHSRISQKSLDFVICAKDASVVVAIELDDRSHQKKIRIEADDTKEKALASAGVSLIRWHVGALPDEAAIRSAVSGAPLLTVVAEIKGRDEAMPK
jgi:very-short-patch-repair endonuclease